VHRSLYFWTAGLAATVLVLTLLLFPVKGRRNKLTHSYVNAPIRSIGRLGWAFEIDAFKSGAREQL